MKRKLRAERQSDGIQKAKSNGVSFGRTKTITDQQIQDMKQQREQGALIKELMKTYNLSKASVQVFKRIETAHKIFVVYYS